MKILVNRIYLFLQIYIDGVPLGELDIKWLRQNIGYIAQVRQLKLESSLQLSQIHRN